MKNNNAMSNKYIKFEENMAQNIAKIINAPSENIREIAKFIKKELSLDEYEKLDCNNFSQNEQNIKKFIKDLMGVGKDNIDYFQKVLGYFITKKIGHEYIVIFSGENDKFIFLKILEKCFGDYFTNIQENRKIIDYSGCYREYKQKTKNKKICHVNCAYKLRVFGNMLPIYFDEYDGEWCKYIYTRDNNSCSMSLRSPAIMCDIHFGGNLDNNFDVDDFLAKNKNKFIKWMIFGAIQWYIDGF